MTTNKDRHIALLELVDFAKSHGFPKAEIAYWDPDNIECGGLDINEIMEDHDPGEYRIQVGVYLNEDVRFTKVREPDSDDIPEESIFPSDGIAP